MEATDRLASRRARTDHHHEDVRAAIAAALHDAIERRSVPNPEVSAAVRARRIARATEIREIADAIGPGGSAPIGHRSTASWLAQATGESIGHCKTTIMLIDRLPHMPQIRSAFDEGEIAESTVRVLAKGWHTSIADVFARDEQLLLGWAMTLPHADVRMLVETWRAYADHERTETESAEQFDHRSLHVSRLLDGMGRLDGVLDPEGLTLVREALRALSRRTEADGRTPAQRRADALVDMARIALEAVEARDGMRATGDDATLVGPAIPDRLSKRNRPKVFATISYDQLAGSEGAGTLDSNLDRSVVPAETIRRLACDAGIHRLVTGPLGTVIDHGRQQRVVTDTQFDRLHLRDHGCRWPGCGVPGAGCDAHHVTHWLDDGETVDENCVLLCWFHHRLLHEQHWRIEPLGAGHFLLVQPDGATLVMRPPVIGLAVPGVAPHPD